MKAIILFSLGTLTFCASAFEATARTCPLVQDVLRTMKCINQGANIYKCSYEHQDWTGNFQSQVDITKTQGSNQFKGRYNNNTCTYTYETPTLLVKYDIVHK